MKIAIILGSVRRNRKSGNVAHYLKTILDDKQAVDTVLLDLRDYNFPVMEERFRYLEDPPVRMGEFSSKLIEADGIIIVTPEYNGSYSGVLKNALDYFRPEYTRKPMGVVTVSNGSFGGILASQHLISWINYVKAIPSPSKLMVKNVDALFNDMGELTDDDFKERASRFIDDFLWLTKAISQAE